MTFVRELEEKITIASRACYLFFEQHSSGSKSLESVFRIFEIKGNILTLAKLLLILFFNKVKVNCFMKLRFFYFNCDIYSYKLVLAP